MIGLHYIYINVLSTYLFLPIQVGINQSSLLVITRIEVVRDLVLVLACEVAHYSMTFE
jgi:hypothetical protein